MQRVDNSTAATTLPVPAPAGTPGYFTGGDPLVGAEATIVDQDWMNSIQEELCNVIAAARPAITLDKTNRAQLLQSLNQLFLPRILVTANTTLYVNASTGNDSNDGTTAGTAVRTLAQAVTLVYQRYNWNSYNATIQLADGTYNGPGGSNTWVGRFVGQPLGLPLGGLTLLGNPSNPDAVQLTNTNGNALGVTGLQMSINGMSVTGTGTTWVLGSSSGMGVLCNAGGWVILSNMRYKNCGMFPVRCDSAIISLTGTNHKVTGASQYGFFAGLAGELYFSGVTLDVTGFSSTSGNWYTDQGRIEGGSATFTGTGSCTGPRYVATLNGVIVTGGGGANYFPGSTAGSIGNGGQYT